MLLQSHRQNMDRETWWPMWNIFSRKFSESIPIITQQAMLFATRNSISSCRPFARRIGNTFTASRTRRRAFPRSPMLSVFYNSSSTAYTWKLDFCAPGEIFLSSGRRTAMASVFVIGRPFNRLKCIVLFSCGRSHFRASRSEKSPFALRLFTFRTW